MNNENNYFESSRRNAQRIKIESYNGGYNITGLYNGFNQKRLKKRRSLMSLRLLHEIIITTPSDIRCRQDNYNIDKLIIK